MKSAVRKGIFLAIFLILMGAAFASEVILIKNAMVVPVNGPVIPGGSLLIKDGKIAGIGRTISVPGQARIIDAAGKYVYPGLVAVMTSVGVTGYPGAGNDIDEVGISTPQMDPYDAINPEDDCIEVTRVGGVTTVHTVSGTSSVINGRSVVLNLGDGLIEDLLLKRYAAQIINIGARENGKYPSTLPGIIALLRDKFDQTRDYIKKLSESQEKTPAQPEHTDSQSPAFKRSLELEALIPVIEGKVAVIFITNDEVTVRKAIEVIEEFKLKGVIQARSGIWKYLDRLSHAKIPVIWAGTTGLPQRWEPYDKNYHTAAALAAHGVTFAFDPGGWGPGNRNVRNLPVPASISVAHGLSEEDAIKAMTIFPARILGIADKVGSLEIGKIANVVIWTGSPVQLSSRVHTVIIEGKIVPLTSIQTRLYEKFSVLVRERMRKK